MVQGSPRGFGFFIPKDRSDDAFLPPHEMRSVMHGDIVRALVFPDKRRPGRWTAKILKVIEKKNVEIAGTLRRRKKAWWLEPLEAGIPQWVLLHGMFRNFQEGHRAVARLTKRNPGRGRPMEGQLLEVLGAPDAPGVESRVILRKFGWPDKFPQEALKQARSLGENPKPEDFKNRRDFRNLPTLTLDGADAKDFDDALSIEELPGGNVRLYVHIADVSHYVPPGSPLDEEARRRSTSVYLADSVSPMFPEELSNGLCSLKEDVPRLTMTAVLDYDARGRLLNADFTPSIIQSRLRGIYEEAQAVLDDRADASTKARYAPMLEDLRVMQRLSRLLAEARKKRGALDLDIPEIKAVLNERGEPVDIRKVERVETHLIVENFMIAANEAVARFLCAQRISALYRIHEPPDAVDVEVLERFLRSQGYVYRPQDLLHPQGLQNILQTFAGTPLAGSASMLILRSLKLAVYSPENKGHFGLGLEYYCHFTSPIRRYPDVVVHRALKAALRKEKNPHSPRALTEWAEHTSLQERLAEKAERESQKFMQLRFMSDKIGKTFAGRISGVTERGLFVELSPFGVEGFLPAEQLPGGPFTFDPDRFALTQARGGEAYRLGDELTVTVVRVDPWQTRQMEVALRGRAKP